MSWGTYEIFSVLSGVVLLVAGLLPATAPRDRLWPLVGGAAFVAYGVYVASQTSGTWTFPVAIFFIPVGAVVYIAWKLLGGTNGDKQPAGEATEAR